VLQGTRINLVENKVVLAVPEGNPAGVASFEDVNTDKVKMIALGNSDVPVGQYSQEIFTNMGVWDAIQSKITFGSNVKEVTTWVSEGTVDCGVVYGTDAYSAGLQVVNTAPADMLKSPVVYPAAVLNITKHEEAAKAFLDYLQTPDCAAIFEGVGFTIPG
jgi:molybdate transport system substrate-binding protein